MKIRPGDAGQALRAFYQAYLVEQDAAEAASYLSDEILWVGSGRLKFIYDKARAVECIEREIAANAKPYKLKLHPPKEQMVAADCVLLLCQLEVGSADGKNWDVRVSAVCRAEEGGCKFVLLHASVTAVLPQENAFFPVQLEQQGFGAFEQQINLKTIDLLGKSIPGGIMGGYLEPDFPFYYVNEYMLAYLGYTYDEFVQAIDGKVINCMHPDDQKRVDQEVATAFARGEEYFVSYRMQKKDGSYIWVNDIGKKGVSEDGRGVCISVIRDISAEVRAKEAMQQEIDEQERQVKRYNHLFHSVLCGIVQYVLRPGQKVVFRDANQEAIRIFGYTHDEFWAKNDWYLPDLIATEDQHYIHEMGKNLTGVGSKTDYEYRLRQKDGSSCWIIGSAEMIINIDGEQVIQSVFLDINNSKMAELKNEALTLQLEAGNQLLRMALQHTNNYEFFYYPQQRLCVVPDRTREHYHCKPRYENMPQSFAEDFIAPVTHADYFEMYRQIHQGAKTASCRFEALEDGVWCRVTLSVAGYDEAGLPSYAVGIVEDVTKEHQMEAALEEARTRDPLTSLYTKDAGIAKVRAYMQSKDPQQVCGMMLLDMDDLGQVNKVEGRVFGDAVLQDVASILREETGPKDYQIRLGGDEFMLFIKDCDKARATVLGPRIAQRIQNIYGREERLVNISASIGMCVTAVVDEYTGLYRCAESSLLYVKEHCKGKAACYLDTSNELGMALTQIYTSEHLFNEIDSKGAYSNEDMADFALDLLGKSKNLDDAIFLLLGRIGNQYGFDRVSILETNLEYLSARYTHQWAKNKADLQMGRDFYFSQEVFGNLPKLYDEEGLQENSVTSYSVMASSLQAAVWNQGVYAGAFAFESRQPDCQWTDQQRKLVKEMAKLISSFIMKARADAVSRAKTDFLSRMSHEIRTPMNAISGMTTIAKTVAGDQQKTLDCLNKIETANGYLLRLINDILDMSRIESGKVELNWESADLAQQLQQLEALLQPQAQEKAIYLDFQNGYLENHPVLLDGLRFNQVLINIIGNAIKFTNEGGITVTVTTQRQTDRQVWLRFAVRDTGIGISEESLGRIFNVFEQSGKETASQYGGTGLGLAISSRLVQMMGGLLEVKSKLGQGSEFYFTLPLTYGSLPANADLSQQGAEQRVDFSGKRLLVAEDNALNLEIAVTILEMWGFVTETANDGQQALDLYSSHPVGYYEAILMDIRMPVMDGLEATRRIRTSGREDARRIPIIAMTANAFDGDSKISLENGMNGHLTKPIVVEDMLALLQQCLAVNSKG